MLLLCKTLLTTLLVIPLRLVRLLGSSAGPWNPWRLVTPCMNSVQLGLSKLVAEKFRLDSLVDRWASLLLLLVASGRPMHSLPCCVSCCLALMLSADARLNNLSPSRFAMFTFRGRMLGALIKAPRLRWCRTRIRLCPKSLITTGLRAATSIRDRILWLGDLGLTLLNSDLFVV